MVGPLRCATWCHRAQTVGEMQRQGRTLYVAACLIVCAACLIVCAACTNRFVASSPIVRAPRAWVSATALVGLIPFSAASGAAASSSAFLPA